MADTLTEDTNIESKIILKHQQITGTHVKLYRLFNQLIQVILVIY